MKRSWIMAAALGCSAWLLAGNGMAADAPKAAASKAAKAKPAPVVVKNRLNNEVSKIDFESALNGKDLKVTFTITDGGWTWVEFNGPVEVMRLMNGGKQVANTDCLVHQTEFMIDLEPGKYELLALGSGEGALAVNRIHRIPELYYYAPASVGGMDILDGKEFWKSIGIQLLESTNLLAPAALTPEQRELYRKAGRKTFFNVMSKPLMKGKEVFNKQIQAKLLEPDNDGFTVDEFNFCKPEEYAGYREALSELVNPEGKRMYTWIHRVQQEEQRPEQKEFLDAVIHPATGKGRVLTEIYMETKETRAENVAFIEKRLGKDAAFVVKLLPNLAPNAGVVVGNYNAMPILTLETVPEVDYKYYLDMQLHFLANNHQFKDLGLVGYWGGNYCQEELQRWCLLLLRHYFVYGNKEMLSPKYGFTLTPGILRNGDFIQDLANWKAYPAEKDSIRHDTTTGKHGYLMQCRWGSSPSKKGGYHDGNQVAVMVKSDKGANKLCQKMVKLTPGKPYQLQFVVGSFDDAANKVTNPRDYGITAVLDPKEVDIREDKLYIDQRPKHRYSADSAYSRANVRRIIFVPKKSEVMLTLTDETSKEPAGTQLMMNFVQVKPYFAPEMMP